jgi:hypothetical protein
LELLLLLLLLLLLHSLGLFTRRSQLLQHHSILASRIAIEQQQVHTLLQSHENKSTTCEINKLFFLAAARIVRSFPSHINI